MVYQERTLVIGWSLDKQEGIVHRGDVASEIEQLAVEVEGREVLPSISYVNQVDRRLIMNLKALYNLSYGLYVISSREGDRLNGQIANTVIQVTSEPPTVAV